MEWRSSTPNIGRGHRRSTSTSAKRRGPTSPSSSEASLASELSRAPKPRVARQRSDEEQETFIRVVARVRPKLAHEIKATDGVEVNATNHSLVLSNSRGDSKKYGVDHVFDSRLDQGSQDAVFSTFGRDFVDHSLRGYNVCLFAYGHTGSGKTYTMLGDRSCDSAGTQAGILPRFLHELFRAHEQDGSPRRYSCEFYEVYNEQIKDLLVPAKSAERTRKVHVHPKHGVRVENLNMSVVVSAEEALRLVEFGNQMRAVATTTMNTRSSRSHAVFTFKYEQQSCDGKSCRSTATFVDLAGREDQSASQNQAAQFREMCCINTSLFHLANVITKLSQGSIDGRSLSDFRNSKLTLLLSPALIGNSRTAVIATVAPLRSYFDDSLCTMNFAASVKKIKTCPVINNKAPNTLVAELEAEVKQLQSELAVSKTGEAEKEKALLSARALIINYKRSWEEALVKSRELEMSRKRSLKSLGLDSKETLAPIQLSGELVPFFTMLSDDPAMQGHCNYFLRGKTLRIGSDEHRCAIVLHGLGILPQMCEVRVTPDGELKIELLTVDEEMPRVLVDGYPLLPSQRARALRHGSCVLMGYCHAFKVVAVTHDQAIEVGSTDACVLARSTLAKLDVASAVSEIVDETGEQFKGILPYISHLSSRIGEDAVQSFLAALHRICPLIDEANLITREVCADDGLQFELRALTNVFKFGRDVPQCVVCVLQDPTPLGTFRRSCQSVLPERNASNISTAASIGSEADANHSMSRHPLVHALGLSDHMLIGGSNVLLYVWSLEKFLWRLNAIREIYQEVSEAGFIAVRKRLQSNPVQNPWREVACADFELFKDRSRRSSAVKSNSPPESPPPESIACSVFPCTPERDTNSSMNISMEGLKRTLVNTPAKWQAQNFHVAGVGCMDSCEDSCSTGSGSHGDLLSMSAEIEQCGGGDLREQGSNKQQSPWAASLSAKVDDLTAEVGQLQHALLHEQVSQAATRAAPTEGISQCSEEVTRWLRQVEGLREMLTRLQAFTDDVHRAALARSLAQANSSDSVKVADRVLQQVQNLKTDVANIVKEELKDQLKYVNRTSLLSSAESTEYSSGQSSGHMTPTSTAPSYEAIVYHPKRQRSCSPSPVLVASPCPPSPGVETPSRSWGCSSEIDRSSFGPTTRTVRKPSPAAKRTVQTPSLRTRLKPSGACSATLVARSPSNSWIGPPSAGWVAPSNSTPTRVVPSSSTPTKAIGRRLSANYAPQRSHSASPPRRFVGPFPKFSWAYYEVAEKSNV